MQCPDCGFDSPTEMKFCGMCGVRLAQVCPACDFANPLDFRFCGQCGTPLIQEPGRSAARASPEAATPGLRRERAVERSAEVRKVSRRSQAQAPLTQLPVGAGVPFCPPSAPIQLEGERRLTTVILADVTGSTDLLERIGTEAWVAIMNRVLHILESEVYRLGGEVDQFRGDGLVAFFGAASAHEDDPERAVLAGLAMQRALKPYAAELAGREGIELLLRVGVNTGEVIVASVGDSRRHREDTAMGEAVALAARMETAADPGTVLVSESTYRLVESRFEWESLGEITVKGVSRPVAVYRPLAPQDDAGRPHRLHDYGLSVPLVGRDGEFQTIKRCVEDLYAGKGGIVMVTGDRGMGKSHLVAQVRQYLVRDRALLAEARDSDRRSEALPLPPLTWLQGRCRSYDQSSPYSMWLDLLRGWLGMREGEPKEETRDRLRRQAEPLWGERLADHYPHLVTFLSLPLEAEFVQRVKHLDAEGLRQQFFLTVRSWVEAIATRGPFVLTFEDLHWVDATSLDLLEYCLPLCDHVPLLWALMFRLDRASPAWEFRYRVETEFPHRAITLTLPPLTKVQSCEFVDRLVGSEVLPAETGALLLDKAEGNPYYIAELVHSLIAQGALAQDAQMGQWRVTRSVASLDLPDTLQSLLLARIDRLSPAERHVLQMAAVIGPVFWSSVLQALTGDAVALREHLTALQRAQLIHERGRVPELGMEYVFKSALIRDAAYEGILSAQRATHHLKVAQYLEDLLGLETPAQYYNALAYHYRQAGRPGKELFYTVQAAEQAKGIYANAEALEYYTRALELLDGMEAQASSEGRLYAIRTQRFEVLNGRREVSFMMGDFKSGQADAEALLPLARQLDDDPTWLIDALLQQSGVAIWQSRGELGVGAPMAEEALALARQLGDRRREMQSLFTIANQRIFLKDPTWQEVGEHALALARQLGDRRYEARILTTLGTFYNWTDQPERGMAYLEAALPICQALDDRRAQVELLNQSGLQAERIGDYYQLLTEYQQEQLKISREIGYRDGEATALTLCGQTQSIYLGDYEGGLARLEEARCMLEGTPAEMFALLRIVQIHAVRGDYDDALASLGRMRVIDEQAVFAAAHAGQRLVSAILYNALGDEAHLRLVLELAAQTRQMVADTPLLTRQYEIAVACESAAAHLGLAACVTDDAEGEAHRRQALESSQTALDLYRSLGFVQIIECVSEEILYRHSLALAANGRNAEAAEYLQNAYDEMMRKHDLIPPDTPFRRTYLENIPLHRSIRVAYAANAAQVR